MEIFVDFGLFEILAASGLVVIGRFVHRHRLARWTCLVTAISAPAALCILAPNEAQRWTAAAAVAASIVNASMVVARTEPPRHGPGSPGPGYSRTP